MLTILEVIRRTADFFEKRGVENPRLNAELIVAHVLGLSRMKLYLQFERPLGEKELAPIRELVRRRGRREPLAYVLGEAAFLDFTLKVDARVLVPRPETEQLVEIVRDTCAEGPPPRAILDLGTGSGAIAIALAAAFPEAAVTAVDAAGDALELAAANAAACGLGDGRIRFLESDWFAGIPGGERFDLIVSNPPYLTEAELAEAEPEVRDFEPRHALVAADGGCADLLGIIAAAPQWLAPGGRLFLETGIDQHARLIPAMKAAGFCSARSIQDWSGRDRFVAGAMAPAGV